MRITDLRLDELVTDAPAALHGADLYPFMGSSEIVAVLEDLRDSRGRMRELEALINAPEIEDFVEGVKREAAHQVARWGEDDRAKKDDEDWIWLLNYLASKALFGKENGAARAVARVARDYARAATENHCRIDDGQEKYLHRIITVAAAALNWHRNRWPGRQP